MLRRTFLRLCSLAPFSALLPAAEHEDKPSAIGCRRHYEPYGYDPPTIGDLSDWIALDDVATDTSTSSARRTGCADLGLESPASTPSQSSSAPTAAACDTA